MARIVMAPGPLELGLLREEYELVQRDLEEQGYDVTIREPEERRRVDPQTAAITYTIAVSLYVGRALTKPTLEEIGRILRDRLVARWRVTRPRKALILGEDGRVLLEVDPERGTTGSASSRVAAMRCSGRRARGSGHRVPERRHRSS